MYCIIHFIPEEHITVIPPPNYIYFSFNICSFYCLGFRFSMCHAIHFSTWNKSDILFIRVMLPTKTCVISFLAGNAL